MKNKLTDLNNHLFAQLERLGDEGLSEDELKNEIARSKAMSGLASSVVSNARLALDAQIAVGDKIRTAQVPEMLEAK